MSEIISDSDFSADDFFFDPDFHPPEHILSGNVCSEPQKNDMDMFEKVYLDSPNDGVVGKGSRPGQKKVRSDSANDCVDHESVDIQPSTSKKKNAMAEKGLGPAQKKIHLDSPSDAQKTIFRAEFYTEVEKVCFYVTELKFLNSLVWIYL